MSDTVVPCAQCGKELLQAFLVIRGYGRVWCSTGCRVKDIVARLRATNEPTAREGADVIERLMLQYEAEVGGMKTALTTACDLARSVLSAAGED